MPNETGTKPPQAPVGAARPAAAGPGAAPAPAAPVAMAPAPAAPGTATPVPGSETTPEVRRAHFQPLQPGSETEGRDNIGMLMDVVVTMTVELGGASIPLRDVLKLGPGSVVGLTRALGEPVDILINREIVGRGEVVVVDDRFGVRVTEILDRNTEPK